MKKYTRIWQKNIMNNEVSTNFQKNLFKFPSLEGRFLAAFVNMYKLKEPRRFVSFCLS